MMLTRKLEETRARLHREKELTVPLGLRVGLEAVSVGAMLFLGVKPVEILLQFLGMAESSSRGRDGLRHFGDLSRGIVATPCHSAIHLGVMAELAFSYSLLRLR